MIKALHLATSFILFLMFSSSIFADQGIYTYSKFGYIFFYSKNNDHILQLTYSGKSKDPVLSPNGKWLAFVMRSRNLIPNACAFSLTKTNYADEIFMFDLKTMRKKILVPDKPDCDHPKKVIIDPNDLQFSPDSKTLYFATSAWATSGAVHAVDVDGKNLRFVTDANEYHIIKHGKYKGDLIVYQHRYRFKKDTPLGSYDWDWLFTPEGKQIKLYKKED